MPAGSSPASRRSWRPAVLAEVDPELRAVFDKLGISLAEQERLSGVAVDAVVDSVSVATTVRLRLDEPPDVAAGQYYLVRMATAGVARGLGWPAARDAELIGVSAAMTESRRCLFWYRARVSPGVGRPT